MLHHCLHNFGMGENECIIHADNCAGNSFHLLLTHAGILSFYSFYNYTIDLIVSIGQNKNRYVLAYFCWRILLGLHKQITYMMQIPEHARYLHFFSNTFLFKIAIIPTFFLISGELYSELFKMIL